MVSSCELDDLPRFVREDQFVDDTVLPPPIGIFRRRLVMVMSGTTGSIIECSGRVEIMLGDFEIARNTINAYLTCCKI